MNILIKISYAFFWGGLILLALLMGRLLYVAVKHVGIRALKEGILGSGRIKMKQAVRDQLTQYGRQYRTVLIAWVVGVLVLGVGLFFMNLLLKR